ncbi:MAG: asparagine synthetase B family protein [Candidatus Njordarchaeales archaeon]
MGNIFGLLPFNNDKNFIIRALDTLPCPSSGKLEIYSDDYIGIGCKSSTSDCSIFVDEKKGYVAIFNGQIYDIQGLRDVDKTKSKAELILMLYEKYLDRFPTYIEGKFSMIVWDPIRRKLLLVRDRFGERSLYYSIYDGYILFSTRIKPILQYEELPKKLDLEAIKLYLSMGYPPSSFTGFKHIFKVPPAHMLVIKYEKGTKYNVFNECYWNPLSSFEQLTLKEEQAAKIIMDKIIRSIRIRLKENRNQRIGVLLSGGLDSATIVSMLKKCFNHNTIEAFTVSYGIKYYDELKEARKISEYLNIPLREYIITPEDINKELISMLAELYEEPFANPSAIGVFNALKLAKDYNVKVIFTGDGGDEAFLGYRSHYWKEPIIIRYYSKLPKKGKRLIAKFLTLVLETLNEIYTSRDLQRIIEFFRNDLMSSPNPEDRFIAKMITGYFKPEELRTLINRERNTKEFSDSIQNNIYAFIRSIYNQLPEINTVLRNNVVLMKLSLTSDVFKVTRPADHFGLDLKIPFLDRDLVETSLKLPLSLRIRNKTTKYILRKILLNYKLLPTEIVESRKKRGFEVPLEIWMREGLKDLAYQIIFENHFLFSLFNKDKIRKLFSKNDRYSALRIWNLLMLAEWYNIFIVEQ